MNNGLLIKREELYKKARKCQVVDSINDFLTKYEKEFTSGNSIEAIKRIKQFLVQKEKENQTLEIERIALEKEIMSTCKHEIVKKNYDQAICLICGHWDFINEINYSHYFFEDLMYPEEGEIYEIISKIAINNQNVFEVFEEYLDQIELNKAKVYCRRLL